MPRATYDDGYEDGYADAESDLGVAVLDSGLRGLVTSTLRRLRMGYDTPTLREVLEEMERIINNA